MVLEKALFLILWVSVMYLIYTLAIAMLLSRGTTATVQDPVAQSLRLNKK